MTVIRDYHEIVQRLASLPRQRWRVEQWSQVSGYPFFVVRRQIASDAPTVFLSGGMHGDEPAGVEAVLRWLEGHTWEHWLVNWLVLPCLNPFGWEHNQRTNADGLDINRQFRGRARAAEAALIKQLIRGQQFLFAMDFHEDCDASGYYICELNNGATPLAETIVRAVRRILPINLSAQLDGRKATGEGFVRRAPACPSIRRTRKHWPMAFHLVCHHTPQTFCSETPGNAMLERRVKAHHAALKAALAGTRPS